MLSRSTKHLYLNLAKKIRTFLLSAKSREFLVFLFFVVVASGFWLLQTLDNDYEMTVDVPLKIKNVPDDVVITAEPVEKIQVKVKDKGSVLLNYLIRRSMKPVSIDFAELKGTGNVVAVPSASFERDIQNRLNISSKIVDMSPDTVSYVYASNEYRRVKVALTGDIRPERQYYVADTLLSPDSVMVYAPRHILDTLTVATTEPLDITGISETTTRTVAIAGIKGVKFVPSEIELTCKVDVYTEKTIEVPVVGVGFPADMVLRTFPSSVSLTFVVGLERFNSIKSSDFVVAVPYEDLMKNKDDKVPVTVLAMPADVTQVNVVPERVDFLIERQNIAQ